MLKGALYDHVPRKKYFRRHKNIKTSGRLFFFVPRLIIRSFRKFYTFYPIQLRKVVMIPVLMRSTNMAPMIGTMRNGFTV